LASIIFFIFRKVKDNILIFGDLLRQNKRIF